MSTLHKSLNRIYTKDKVTVPSTLGVFLKYYSHFVLFYKPLNVFEDTQTWLQLLLQRLEESNIKEKNISAEQLGTVLQQFEKEWDEDHIRDYNAILASHADDELEEQEDESEPLRVMPDPAFEKMITDFAREVIRYSPSELIKFAQRYFKALESGKVDKYLQKMADQRSKLLPGRLATEEDIAKAHDFLHETKGVAVEHANTADTISLIQKTIQQEAEERKTRAKKETAQIQLAKKEQDEQDQEEHAKLEAELLSKSNVDLGALIQEEFERKEEPKAIAEEDEDEDAENPLEEQVEDLEE